MKIRRTRTLQSPKYLKKKRKKFIIMVSVISSAVIFLIVSLILILRISFFQIKTIEIDGAETVNSIDLENTVRSSLLGNYLYVFPKSSFFFYPKSEIYKNLQNQYFKIESIKIDTSFFSRKSENLAVTITERKSDAIVCNGFRQDEENDECYYVDKNGFVFEKSSITNIASTTAFIYFNSLTINSKVLGANFIPEEVFISLQNFIDKVSKFGVVATGMLVGDDGSYELYIKNTDGSSATVYFDNRTSLDTTASNLGIFWQNILTKKIGITSVPSFEYINLRFGNNIFYLIKPDVQKKK